MGIQQNVRIRRGRRSGKQPLLPMKGYSNRTVMFFGLTNSPATVQMMMNAIFQEEIHEGLAHRLYGRYANCHGRQLNLPSKNVSIEF